MDSMISSEPSQQSMLSEKQPNTEEEKGFETPNSALAVSLPVNPEEIQYGDDDDDEMQRRIEWGEAWLRAAIADGSLDLSPFCREGEEVVVLFYRV